MERLFRMCMAPMGEGGEGGGGAEGGAGAGGAGAGGGEGGGTGENGAGAGSGAGAGAGGAGGNSQFVPYSRFQEVNNKHRDLESKYSQMEAMLNKMRGALSPEQQKQGFKLDYQNPDKSIEEFVRAELDARQKAMEEKGSQRETEVRRSAAIKWFKSQEDYSPEMEEKAAAFIKENGLQGLDPQKAIEIAYKFVTLGDGSGYTRKVKEGMIKPGAGGKGKGADVQNEIANLDPKDPQYSEKMRALHAKLMSGGGK